MSRASVGRSSFLGWFVCLTTLIETLYARGYQTEGEIKQPFEIEARDPVPYSQAPKRPDIIYTNGAYAELDLSYYEMFYHKYSTFIGTDAYVTMLQTLTDSVDDVMVCVNFDVTASNKSLGAFTCPLPFEPSQLTKCCGLKEAEFCCTANTDRATGIAAFLVITLSIIVTAIVAYFIVGKER